MPLPPGGPWPPPTVRRCADRLSVWHAWWSGDPDALTAVYGGQNTYGAAGDQFFGSQTGTAGAARRVVSRFRNWFWGTPTPPGEKNAKLHIPLASDIAETSADLLFGEMPALTCDTPATQDRLAGLVGDAMHSALLEAAEMAAALGGVYLRVCWDRDARPDGPWLTSVAADMAAPEWAYDRLAAVTFWRTLADDGRRVIRHLERHEPGAILHGLYEGDRDTLGRMVPLTEAPDTAELAGVVDENSAIPTGATRLTAAYVPNVRPNRLWRDQHTGPLGRADIASTEPLMDALDLTYTSWMRDVRLGRARLIVPNSYLTSVGRGQGAVWEDRELMTGLDSVPDDDGTQITQVQFAIRVAEHRDTATELVAQILRTAGYSTQTFGEMGDVAATATEVNARERRSMTTRARKIGYWRPGLQDALEALLQVDAVVFKSGTTPDRPRLEWPDAVAPDPGATAQTTDLLRRAGAASTDTLVRMVHPDWAEDQVTAEVGRIQAEAGDVGLAGHLLTG